MTETLIVIGIGALLALGYYGYRRWYVGSEVEDAVGEASDEIKELGDVLNSVREDVREAVAEIEDLLDKTEVDDRILDELKSLRDLAADKLEDSPPGILIEQAVRKGEEFGRKFPGHVEDLEREVRDVHGELADLTEFLRTFFETAKSSAKIQLEKESAEMPSPSMKLPKEGDDRFPHIGYLESAGIETYGDLLQHKSDFTAIKQIGPSRAEDIEDRLEDDGFKVS